MKKTLAIILCILMMLPVTSFASDTLSVSAVFDAETQDVVISGSGISGDIIITVADRDNTDVFSNQNPPYDIISVANTGSFETVISLSSSAAGKRLTVVATDKLGTVASDGFIYPDFDGTTSVIASLNSADSLSEFTSFAKPNALDLGFDTESDIYLSSESDIYAILYAIKPENATASDYYALFYNACALASFDGADADEVEQILNENAVYFGIDYNADYVSDTRLDDEAKEALCLNLSKEKFGDVLSSDESFAKYFEKAKALANISTAENWQEIKLVMETDFEDLFTLSSLSASNAQKVYGKMMSCQYSSFDDIDANYNKAIKSVESENKSSSSPSSGGGGGGFGGGSSVSLPPVVDIKLPEDSQEGSKGEKTPMVTLPSGAFSSFSDVPDSHWSYESVSALTEAKIINGYDANTFLPDNNITRAEFTKLICISFGIPSIKADYADVAEDAWYNGYVGGASLYGIVNGYGEVFDPDSPITRQDAAVIVYRALKNEGIILNGSADFADFNDISLYALTAVGAFKEYGILSGDGTNFYPLNNITRAEAAKLLYNALGVNQ